MWRWKFSFAITGIDNIFKYIFTAVYVGFDIGIFKWSIQTALSISHGGS